VHDVTIVGGGATANSCHDVLTRNGLSLTRAFELDPDDTSPLILGESHAAYPMARQAVDAGRHVLIASPQVLTPERLSLLLESRGRGQALFVWSERRYHPAYRMLAGLTEADATWRPRFLRSETLSTEPSSAALFRLRALESVGLVAGIAADEPVEVAAHASANTKRNSFDLLNLEVTFPEVEAFIQIGLGEALDRRETLLAADSRKAYVDELEQTAPVRLVDDDAATGVRRDARWLACLAPSSDDLARGQCIAFLNACLKPKLAQEEALLWHRSLEVLAAMERSLDAHGSSIRVQEPEEASAPTLRLILPDAA
jgi:hypothetical protein